MTVDSNGSVWLITNQRVMQYNRGTWSDHLSQYDGKIIGLDSNHHAWVVSNDDSEIAVWDGAGWLRMGSETGWIPPDHRAGTNWSMTTDASNRVWIASDHDARMFDHARWTIFTFDDMAMPRPDEDTLSKNIITFLNTNGTIWVINCHWMGPGPIGGAGARWYDGQTWRGSDSPVASGCATAINEDRVGNIWLGLGDDLWNFSNATGDWENFPAPNPPDELRFGYVIDLAIDPDGAAWPELALCGGASCGVGSIRYYITGDTWTQTGDVFMDEGSLLYFDADGQGWIFRSNGIFHVTDNQPELVAELPILSAASAPSGELWVAGIFNGETVIWSQTPDDELK